MRVGFRENRMSRTGDSRMAEESYGFCFVVFVLDP